MQFQKNYLIILILTIFVFGACKTAPNTFDQVQKKDATIDGLELSEVPYNTALIDKLKAKIKNNEFRDINGIVVLNKGKIQIEEYFNGENRLRMHNPRSVGKTFASAVLGIALQEGHINSLDQKLGEFYEIKNYENYSAKKEEVQIRHLLTMSSAFNGNDSDYDSPGNEENMYPKDNWVEWTLNLPMSKDRNSGDKWNYFTAGVVVLGDIIHKSVPGGLEQYAHEKLFTPMGIKRYRWQFTPQNVANTAGGLSLTALGFAKFGQLYKNGGRWKEQQIIPEQWVKDSFQKHIETSQPPNYYGYLWWNKAYEINEKSYETYYCTGNGGNKIFVFTELDMVIVVTASAYGQRYAHPQVDKMMEEYILPAVL